jgi:hypothetical protein
MTTNLDTLLAQALALASEDRRGELADVMEQIITQALEQATQIHLVPPETLPAHLGSSDIVHFGYVFGYQDGQVALRQAIRARAILTDPAPKREPDYRKH